MKSDVIKPEFLRLPEIFQVKIFKRKPEKVGVVVRFCAADIPPYIHGLVVYRYVFTVLPYFTKTKSAAMFFLLSV